jgi:DNA ligase (NAD+)
MTRIDELVNKLNKLRDEYYNDSSNVNDEEFDFYERELKSLDPNNPYFNQVGAKISSELKEVEHEYPMLSMNKVQTLEDMEKWYETFAIKYGKTVFIDPKLDGISGTVKYDKYGYLEYVATRGDGIIGAIIPFGDKIYGVPQRFRPNSELRGEFIINKKYKNVLNGPLRNICSGIMKRKNYTDDVKYLSFVIYDLRSPDKNYFFNRRDKINKIKAELFGLKQECICVPVIETSNMKEAYENYIHKWRDEYEFETDGMILTVDGDQKTYDLINSQYKIKAFNRYNIAIKPPAQFAESEILDIIPSVNRRKVSYVAKIKPVYLLDTLISNATLDNFQNIKRNNIGIGTKVLVKRTNDVIPKVYNFYNEPNKKIKKIDFSHCPVCGSKLVPVYQDLMCPNEFGCLGIYKSKIENIIKTFDVKNVGDSIIHAITMKLFKNDLITKMNNGELFLYNFFKGFKPNGNTYELEDFIIEHFNGGKRPEIFKEAIFKMYDNLTEVKVISCFNIPYIGESALLNHGIKTFEDLEEYVLELKNKPVLESSFDSTIFNWWNNNVLGKKDLIMTIDLLKDLFKTDEIVDNQITYCISGAVPEKFGTKQNFIDEINNKYRYVKDVTSATDLLITNEHSTSKVVKAHKYGVKIITFDEFLKNYY